MIEVLLSAVKFAIGGGSGVLTGLILGRVVFTRNGKRYVHAAAIGYVAGFFVNFSINYLIGNLAVHP